MMMMMQLSSRACVILHRKSGDQGDATTIVTLGIAKADVSSSCIMTMAIQSRINATAAYAVQKEERRLI